MNILSEPLVKYLTLFSFLIFFFRIVISNLFKKKCDSQFIQNRADLIYTTAF